MTFYSSKYIPITGYMYSMPHIGELIRRQEDMCDFCGDIEETIRIKKDDMSWYRACQKCLFDSSSHDSGEELSDSSEDEDD